MAAELPRPARRFLRTTTQRRFQAIVISFHRWLDRRQLTLAGLRTLFRHRRRDHAVARANPHRFRHTFGADMARSGVRLPILQRMMGHADGATTLRYIQLSMADIADEYRRAVEKLQRRYQVRR